MGEEGTGLGGGRMGGGCGEWKSRVGKQRKRDVK